jgi:hypothetical protein
MNGVVIRIGSASAFKRNTAQADGDDATKPDRSFHGLMQDGKFRRKAGGSQYSPSVMLAPS